jgi:hypothetical protein
MAKFAIVIDGVIDNILVADSHPAGIDVTGLRCGPGWTYDGETFSPPVRPVTPDPPKKWSARNFIGEFTLAERGAILAASQTDSMISAYILTLQVAGTVRAEDQDTIDGLHYLESQGHIGAGRADEILGVSS